MLNRLLLLLLCFAFVNHAQCNEKPFVIVVPSRNNAEWYKRNLDSIFNQNYSNYRVIYIADGPTDGTDQLVQQYIADNHREHKVTFLSHKKPKGTLACMCRAVFTCCKEEIVVDLEGCDWLVHDEVLSTLNNVYADPEVWMTYGQFKYYPSNEKGFAEAIPRGVIQKNTFRSLTGCVTHLRTFYASLFHEIDKEDFLHHGEFFPEAGDLAYLLPILEMSGSHSRLISYPLYAFNLTFPATAHRYGNDLAAEMDRTIRAKSKYNPLLELPTDANTPPALIYSQIKDIAHPTTSDYRFVQNYLHNGKRDNLEQLGQYQFGQRHMKIFDQMPSAGRLCVNCAEDDRENCVIAYVSFNRNYPRGLKRLLSHILGSDFKGHVLFRYGGWPDEEGKSLQLAHVPYAFKASFFKEAQRLGYKRVLWLDASVIPVASLNDIFARIEKQGYFVMGNSHNIGPFMNAKAAAYFGLTLAETFQIPSCSSGLFGVDFTQEKPRLLLDLWYRAAFDPNAFFSARPDQNSLSMLLYQFDFTDLTDLSFMPHAEIGESIKPDSLFYLDRLFVQ